MLEPLAVYLYNNQVTIAFNIW